MMLFAEMLADHGVACEGGQKQIRPLLDRQPQPVDTAIREYYAGRAKAAWTATRLALKTGHRERLAGSPGRH